MLELESTYGEGLDAEAAQRVRDLLEVRRELLDELLQRGGRYSDLLVEYRTIATSFYAQMQEVERFLYSHVLWSRSVPKPLIPRPNDMAAAFRWLTSTDHLQGLPVGALEIVELDDVVVLALLLLVVLLRRPLRRRLVEISKSVSDPKRDSLRFTIEALAITAVMAAPLPTVLYTASVALGALGGSMFWLAAARAFSYVALVALLLESIRQIFAASGLAEAHFGWPAEAARPLHRGLLGAQAIGLPLLYVALHLAFAGMRLQSPEELQLHNNTLGRMAFIAALLVLGLSILGMLRPAKKEQATGRHVRVPWPRRFAGYAFPAAFLWAYPIVTLATLVPAALAAVGFYITGMLLAYQMLRTMLLVGAVMVGGGVVHRWRAVNRHRVLLASVGQPDEESQRKEYEASDKQARQLFRFGALVVVAAGLFSIWSEALPMLELLKRVQLLPRVELLEPTEDRLAGLTTVAHGATTQPESGAEPTAAASFPETPGPGVEKVSPDAGREAGPRPLTVWDLLEAILVGLITLGLVKNLPGVIEIELRRRTTLDGGVRFALSTLVRYSIIIIGTIAVSGLLGITWNKVQWLAAALTFGLGFGLQEIVANFVSGLILLVERPVRVGDVVTIGNLMGTVSRIQIRATTISLWDRSEMIVPNKEFITTKLVNWTLSDSKRRIEIPVRIGYGTNLERVKEVLVETAKQHPAVLDDPPPLALVLGLGEDAVNIELRFVVDFGQGLSTKDEVQIAIERRFQDEGIEFALPTSRVRLQPGSESS
jgi:potassium efflux system protein